MLDTATFVKGVAQWEQLPADGHPEIAVVGRWNVGKSSLLNVLLDRKKLAHTSKTPGKTRQFNFFEVDNRFYLVDLPGYGYAKAPGAAREEWAQLQERYLAERQPLRGVVQLIDSRHPPMDGDVDLVERLRDAGVPHAIALAKADKLSGNGRAQAQRRVDDSLADLSIERPVHLTSANTNRGTLRLRRWILAQIETYLLHFQPIVRALLASRLSPLAPQFSLLDS